MIYYTIKPVASLSRYVRFFWVFESGPTSHEPYVYRSMADGCAEMVFHYSGVFTELLAGGGENGQNFALMHAPSQAYRRFSTLHSFGIFGVYLYPFAIPAIFGIPSAVLSDQMPDLKLLAGQQGSDLEEQIMGAASNTERITILSNFLQRRLEQNSPVDDRMELAISAVIHSKQIMPVDKLAGYYCLSTRQFERRFKQSAGFSPKKFSRLIRFHTALNDYGLKGRSLTEIAYHCGYYDQSHFISEFKSFSGYNPKTYFAGGAEGTEYRD